MQNNGIPGHNCWVGIVIKGFRVLGSQKVLVMNEHVLGACEKTKVALYSHFHVNKIYLAVMVGSMCSHHR